VAADFKENTEVEMSMRTLSKADECQHSSKKSKMGRQAKLLNFNNGQKLVWPGNNLKLMRVRVQ
jgi:hypothetical protein